jgi:hypothetical protein
MNKTHQAVRAVAGILVFLVVPVGGRQALAEERSWVLQNSGRF